MMTQMFDLLDNDGLHYVNADVLWITDFLIPDPPQQLLSRFREYKETVPDSTASASCVMKTRSRTAGRSTSIRFTLSGTARCEDIKEDIKAEKDRKRVSDDKRDTYKMYQELYHMLHLAQNFGFAPFLNKKFLKTLGDTKYICTFVLGTMNNCQPNKLEKNQ